MSTRIGKIIGLSLTTALLVFTGSAKADEQMLLDKIKAMEQRIVELEGRTMPPIDKHEEKPVEETPENKSGIEELFTGTHFSGFASVSYFYDFNRTEPIMGRLYDVNHNEFEL